MFFPKDNPRSGTKDRVTKDITPKKQPANKLDKPKQSSQRPKSRVTEEKTNNRKKSAAKKSELMKRKKKKSKPVAYTYSNKNHGEDKNPAEDFTSFNNSRQVVQDDRSMGSDPEDLSEDLRDVQFRVVTE